MSEALDTVTEARESVRSDAFVEVRYDDTIPNNVDRRPTVRWPNRRSSFHGMTCAACAIDIEQALRRVAACVPLALAGWLPRWAAWLGRAASSLAW